MIQDLTSYALTGLIVAILIPWACLETASFFSELKPKHSRFHRSHWLWAATLLASLTMAGCAGGSKDNAGAIVSPKGPSGAGATRTEGEESVLPSGGEIVGATSGGATTGSTTAGTSDGGGSTTAGGSGGSSGGSGGPTLGEPPLDSGLSPALIMQVVNTILN